MIFWSKFTQKWCFWPKGKKLSITIEVSIFKLFQIWNFSLKQEFSFLRPNLPKNSISSLKQKTEHAYWIVYIQIGLNTEFQVEITIFTFRTKFAQNGYFWNKAEKVSITIEFCIFKLIEISNFSLKQQFCIPGPNLPENGVSGLKQKNCASFLNSAYSNQSEYEISASNNNFIFWDQICPKTVSLLLNRQVRIPTERCIFKLLSAPNFSLK